MNVLLRLALTASLVCGVCAAIHAQPGQGSRPNKKEKNAPEKTRSPEAKNNNSEAEIANRRVAATALLVSLGNDARSFQDQPLRARTLARVADVLWDEDSEQAKSLFRKAWESAETADSEALERYRQEITQQKSKTGGSAVAAPPTVRREVLRLATRRDRALGDEFLKKLEGDKSDSTIDRFRPTDGLLRRLSLAQDLLDAGQLDLALQFADPAMMYMTMQTVNFLSYLREKDANAADERYLAMLTNAAADPRSDANTVSVLSSYIFSPHFFVTFRGGGSTSTSQFSDNITPPQADPRLRWTFFQNAAVILLRPLPPREQDTTTSGVEGKYLVIKRLMPLFAQYAPPEIAGSLRAQLDTLTALVQTDVRDRDDQSLHKGIQPEQEIAGEQLLLDQVDRARTSADRDNLYLQLAMIAAGKADLRARDFVQKIEEPELRKSASAYIDPILAIQLIEKKQIDQALTLTRTGDLTHVEKVWVWTVVAKQLSTSDPTRCMSLLDSAAAEAQRIDVSDPNRPRSMFAVSNVLLPVERTRGWDTIFDDVKAANSAEGYTGEGGSLSLKLRTKTNSSVKSIAVADFDVAGIFASLATDNYDRAVEMALEFKDQAPRSSALIAIARTVLSSTRKLNKQVRANTP